MPHLSFPNESAEYRTARNKLLEAEVALRRQLEEVAAQRRELPLGGVIAEDFVFERIGENEHPEVVKLSELFGKYPSILLYSFMYGPERDEPCTGCTHTLDGLDGSVFHADQRFPTYIVAKSPIARLQALAAHAAGEISSCFPPPVTTTTTIISATLQSSEQTCALLVDTRQAKTGTSRCTTFSKDADGTVRHFWGSEMLYVQEEPGQNHRAGDLVDPVWGLRDMMLEGRGNFFPKLGYD